MNMVIASTTAGDESVRVPYQLGFSLPPPPHAALLEPKTKEVNSTVSLGINMVLSHLI